MEEEKRNLLNANRIKISQTLNVDYCLMFLREQNIFDIVDQQNVQALANDQQRAGCILDMLEKRGNEAFFAFCHACVQNSPTLFEILHNDTKINIDECLFCKEQDYSCMICKEMTSVINTRMKRELMVNKQEDLPNACEKLIQKYKSSRIEVEAGRTSFATASDNWHTKICELTGKIHTLGTEKDTIQSELHELKSRNKILHQENVELKQENSSLRKNDIETFYQNQDFMYKEKFKAAMEDLEKCKREKEILEERFKRLEYEKSTTEEMFVQLNKNCRIRYGRSESNIEDILQEKTERLVHENEALLSSVQRLEVKNQGLTSKLTEVENERDNLCDIQEKNTQELALLRPFKENYEKIKKISHYFKQRQLDRTIIIKKIKNQLGISFNTKDAHVGESCVFLTRIDRTHLIDNTYDVRPGDFIMAINDIDVTEFSKEKAEELLKDLKGKEDRIVLRIRRPIPEIKTFPQIDFARLSAIPKRERNSTGINLVTVLEVEPNSIAAGIGLCSGDQLVKVNRESAREANDYLSKKILKCAQNAQGELTLKRISRDKTLLEFGNRVRSSSEQYYSISGPVIGQENSDYSRSRSCSASTYNDNGSSTSISNSYSESRAPQLPMRMREITNSSAYDTMSFQQRDRNSFLESQDYEVIPPRLSMTVIKKLRKLSHSFGFKPVGGNKIGIFVKEIEQNTDAFMEGVQVGWKIIKIGSFDMANAALCYAVKTLQSFREGSVIPFEFEEVSMEKYQKQLEMVPHDFFSIKAMIDYEATNLRELSFKRNEQLFVESTYETVDFDPMGPHRWRAYKEGMNGFKNSGYIPNHSWTPRRNGRGRSDHIYTMVPGDEFLNSGIYLIQDRSVVL